MLKKLFPISFKYADSVSSLIIGIIIYIVAAVLGGLLIGLANVLFGWSPFVNTVIILISRVLGALIEVYVVAGIVVQVLAFLKIVKE